MVLGDQTALVKRLRRFVTQPKPQQVRQTILTASFGASENRTHPPSADPTHRSSPHAGHSRPSAGIVGSRASSSGIDHFSTARATAAAMSYGSFASLGDSPSS